ncbi:MAG: DUF5684 domain-containing protein [Cytophagaceae bacterium]|jgi:hypothetical protein|nr:DUF5684 domain-containing protein [Cytophagaceae bacterium]
MEIVLYALLLFLFAVYMIASVWRIYSKANQPGWAAIIPIYQVIILLRIVERPWWWIFLFCIPIANIVFVVIVVHRLSKSFGRGVGFTLGLLFLPFIFFPLLAFGDFLFKGFDNNQNFVCTGHNDILLTDI